MAASMIFRYVFIFMLADCLTSGYESCNINGTLMDCRHRDLMDIPNLFDQSGSIEELDLSFNKLKVVSSINVSNPSVILKLSFSHNNIDTFVRGVLDPFTKLEVLDLSYNQISGSSLHIETFKYEIGHFESIKRLILRGNHLGTLERLTFTAFGFATLEYLDLSHCSLATLQHMSIDNLYNLKYLDLSFNEVTSLEAISLEGLSELEILVLSNNKMTVLDEIPRSLYLKEIYLDNNKLLTIKENILHMFLNLQIISLKGNRLKTLYPHMLPLDSMSLKDIRLDGNPFHCDCNIRWIVEQRKEFTFKNFSIRCIFPSRMRKKNIFEIPSEDLVCNTGHSKMIFRLVLFLTLIFVAASIGLIIFLKRKSLPCKNKNTLNDVITYTKVRASDELDTDKTTDVIMSNEGDSLVQNEVPSATSDE